MLYICLHISCIHNITLASDDHLNILSDKLTIKKDQLTATFSGSVLLTFNELKIYTSKLIIYYRIINGEKELHQIVIPDTLKAIRLCNNEILIADKALFDNSTKKLILEGNVITEKANNILITKKLIYSANLKNIDYID